MIFYEIVGRKIAKQIADLLSDYDRTRTGPCGRVGPLQNDKKETAHMGGTGGISTGLASKNE
jgi:hypothetical protein